MKFLITGVNGQLGYDIREELWSRGYTDILAPTSQELDITDEQAVERMIYQYHPDIIFHCAAYTKVDQAEMDRDCCFDVNVNGTKYLTEGASRIGARIIYISTDYVFNGMKNGFYVEDDLTVPVNFYGKTKYLGEEEIRKYFNHVIVRISWVFSNRGKNFLKTMLQLAENRSEVCVVSDQIGSPTYTPDLSRLLVNLALSNVKGTYHASNEGECSWAEYAKYIFEESGIDMVVHPILTKDYPTVAKRPLNSRLSKDKLERDGFERLPDWKDAVKRCVRVLKKEEHR